MEDRLSIQSILRRNKIEEIIFNSFPIPLKVENIIFRLRREPYNTIASYSEVYLDLKEMKKQGRIWNNWNDSVWWPHKTIKEE